jgi:hypothetical protein
MQLCAAVLIAAILRPVIRADGMTHASACRDWTMPKLADDRRGAERVGPRPSREGYEPKAHSSGARPGWQQPMPSGRQLSAAVVPYDCGAPGRGYAQLNKC